MHTLRQISFSVLLRSQTDPFLATLEVAHFVTNTTYADHATRRAATPLFSSHTVNVASRLGGRAVCV